MRAIAKFKKFNDIIKLPNVVYKDNKLLWEDGSIARAFSVEEIDLIQGFSKSNQPFGYSRDVLLTSLEIVLVDETIIFTVPSSFLNFEYYEEADAQEDY